jgi:hypothetical protein
MVHALGWFVGMYPVPQGTSPMYQFWSGFFPDLLVFAAVVGGYKRLNCHKDGCWRIGTHPDGVYRLCRKHHPNKGDTSDRSVSLGEVSADT